eukprot:TRINITY_DN3348_c2_g1_i4.p2 TRINITY_DN3348_c2_g1~~TRINITY_DN3348_c2_g1_i4.p2  ORF type:complete len:121 (+),score=34.79 TRINITY_DN3348_c2_g1_i4:284-646(+)
MMKTLKPLGVTEADHPAPPLPHHFLQQKTTHPSLLQSINLRVTFLPPIHRPPRGSTPPLNSEPCRASHLFFPLTSVDLPLPSTMFLRNDKRRGEKEEKKKKKKKKINKIKKKKKKKKKKN